MDINRKFSKGLARVRVGTQASSMLELKSVEKEVLIYLLTRCEPSRHVLVSECRAET